MGQREDVRCIAVEAAVAERGKFVKQDAAVYAGVHFAKKDGTFFGKEAAGAAKDGNFGAFDIAFDEIGSRIVCGIGVEGNGVDGDSVGGRKRV